MSWMLDSSSWSESSSSEVDGSQKTSSVAGVLTWSVSIISFIIFVMIVILLLWLLK